MLKEFPERRVRENSALGYLTPKEDRTQLAA